jgi:hypothetical protein
MKKIIKKVKKTLHCNKCKFSTNNAGALAIHKIKIHPAEKPVWRSYRELVTNDSDRLTEWGREQTKKDFEENVSTESLIYGMLLLIFDELKKINQELRRTKTIN